MSIKKNWTKFCLRQNKNTSVTLFHNFNRSTTATKTIDCNLQWNGNNQPEFYFGCCQFYNDSFLFHRIGHYNWNRTVKWHEIEESKLDDIWTKWWKKFEHCISLTTIIKFEYKFIDDEWMFETTVNGTVTHAHPHIHAYQSPFWHE